MWWARDCFILSKKIRGNDKLFNCISESYVFTMQQLKGQIKGFELLWEINALLIAFFCRLSNISIKVEIVVHLESYCLCLFLKSNYMICLF